MKLIENLGLLVGINVYSLTIFTYYHLKATFHDIILSLHSLEASKGDRKEDLVAIIVVAILVSLLYPAGTRIFDNG